MELDLLEEGVFVGEGWALGVLLGAVVLRVAVFRSLGSLVINEISERQLLSFIER